MPELTRKSTRTDLIFVCPDLKSSPPMNTWRCSASSITPGTNVFCGLPLMYAAPSRTDATANSVDGEISDSLRRIDSNRALAESFNPARTSQKRSVLADHRTITYTPTYHTITDLCLSSLTPLSEWFKMSNVTNNISTNQKQSYLALRGQAFYYCLVLRPPVGPISPN